MKIAFKTQQKKQAQELLEIKNKLCPFLIVLPTVIQRVDLPLRDNFFT